MTHYSYNAVAYKPELRILHKLYKIDNITKRHIKISYCSNRVAY